MMTRCPAAAPAAGWLRSRFLQSVRCFAAGAKGSYQVRGPLAQLRDAVDVNEVRVQQTISLCNLKVFGIFQIMKLGGPHIKMITRLGGRGSGAVITPPRLLVKDGQCCYKTERFPLRVYVRWHFIFFRTALALSPTTWCSLEMFFAVSKFAAKVYL